MLRRLAAALCIAVALLAPAGVFAQEPQASLPDIEDEVMCPVCGVGLDLVTEAPQALRQREFIRTLIAEGLTKEEIKDRLVAEYGSEVLASPAAEGFDLAAWLVPGGAIVIAGVAILVAVRRWRHTGRSRPPAAQGRARDQAENERLDADLARYEL